MKEDRDVDTSNNHQGTCLAMGKKTSKLEESENVSASLEDDQAANQDAEEEGNPSSSRTVAKGNHTDNNRKINGESTALEMLDLYHTDTREVKET